MSAHILLIADGRSPTALSWITNIQALGYTVSLVSTFPCNPPEGVRHFSILPIAFSQLSPSAQTSLTASDGQPKSNPARRLIRHFAPVLQPLRDLLGPLTVARFARPYKALVSNVKPDLVHALRIPFEGMLGSYTPKGIPFIAATWGNDLTLHASASPLMRTCTQRCLARADGFTADTQRDVRLARNWGLPADVPTLVVPGSGGLDLKTIFAAPRLDPGAFGLPASGVFVVNPRGMRPKSVHQDVFFAAIPAVLTRHPEVHFICPNLAENRQAETWVNQYGIQNHTHLLPKLSQPQLWSLLKSARVFVSPSSHDGTPNSLLEAMSCGCFPIVGDIESLREWIDNSVNGLLVDPRSPARLGEALCQALEDQALRQKATEHNLALVTQRASQETTRPQIYNFYEKFVSGESGIR
ncbi:MAG TPA: glycosyltransferase family 4 protein [Brevefilum sp.]|nr:glycosyltransferase family 4 protein [Brevefilum sp.]HOR19588.1 glycosyltransferase family 4 protein [Brevefilum sp.]HPL70265.1 glycosyltransferase family 4 protein [Brevefilum sp.]